MRASIVIPTYHRNGVLVGAIRSLLAVMSAEDELIVVDQAPRHDRETAEYLAALRNVPNVSIVELAEPSTTHARNVGASLARSSVVIYVDDDVEVHPGFVEGHLNCYRDPAVGAVAGHCIVQGKPFPMGSGTYVGKVFGANMSFRLAALVEVGGFDENIVSGWREETECADRLLRAGWKIANGTDAVLVHLEAIEGGSGDRMPTDAWYRRFYHNVFYTLLKKPPHEAVLRVPRTMAGALWHRYPGHARMLSPRFLVMVLGGGVLDAFRNRFAGPSGPFLLRQPEDGADGRLHTTAGAVGDGQVSNV